MSTLPLSGVKLTIFLRHPAFPLFTSNVPLFCAYFELGKMRSMRSAQRQVELRRLVNQLPVLPQTSNHILQLEHQVLSVGKKFSPSDYVDSIFFISSSFPFPSECCMYFTVQTFKYIDNILKETGTNLK